MTRLRIIVVALLLATVFAAASGAASPRELLPGVTYERIAQRTLQGPLVLHVVRAPRPGGLYDLRPVLATDTIVGRETVTSMQKRLAGEATMVGVNADFFDLAVGRPSGILMRDTALIHPPTGGRSSVGITLDGRLDVQRVQFFATWRATGEAHPLDDLNQAPGPNEIALFSSSWGSVTPAVPGAVVAILFPLPLPAPGADLTAPVLELRQASAPVPIPPGGAVLVATGSAAAELQAEAPVGSEVAIQLILRPEWPEVVHAVGGGPVIVRDGKPVFRANEEFLQSQLGPRFPRTAVGQTADGRLLLVTVDGRSAESVGVTNWGLAQAMVRLGAVTAAAMDSGGSSTLAFDGVVLNTPSDRRGERPVADALMLAYTGVYAPPGEVVTSALRPLEVD
ncbi:MAG: phosphodiester glycosidase family protein, partial [Actinobacteria bacterium]|nr:phosphodiester glycosidase family protein [Actinomycetota bacterium]